MRRSIKALKRLIGLGVFVSVSILFISNAYADFNLRSNFGKKSQFNFAPRPSSHTGSSYYSTPRVKTPAEKAFSRGFAAKKAGNINKAIYHYEKAVRLNPNNSAAWNNLANCYRIKERYYDAIAAYERALEIKPNDRLYKNNYKGLKQWADGKEANTYGWQLVEQGDYASAVEQFRLVVKTWPKWVPGHLRLAYALKEAGDLKQAEKIFLKALRLKPSSEDLEIAQFWLASIYTSLAKESINNGKNSKAIQFCEKAVKYWPKRVDGYYILGKALQDKGDHKGAIRLYKKAVKKVNLKNPEIRQLWTDLILSQTYHASKASEHASAVEFSRLAMKVSPNDESVKNCLKANLWDQYRYADSPDEKIGLAQQLIKLDQTDARGYCLLGDAFLEKGDIETAKETYREGAQYSKYAPTILVELANKLKQSGNLKEFREIYSEATQMAAQKDSLQAAQIQYELATTLVELQDGDGAEAAFHRVIDLAPDSIDLHMKMGKFFLEQGAQTEALVFLQRAVSLAQAHPDQEIEFSEVISISGIDLQQEAESLLEQGKINRALIVFAKALALDPDNVQLQEQWDRVYHLYANAGQQLKSAKEHGQKAVWASTKEEAKKQSNYVFDTPGDFAGSLVPPESDSSLVDAREVASRMESIPEEFFPRPDIAQLINERKVVQEHRQEIEAKISQIQEKEDLSSEDQVELSLLKQQASDARAQENHCTFTITDKYTQEMFSQPEEKE
jgi:tetratricopeptide (TPR) repeat protein